MGLDGGGLISVEREIVFGEAGGGFAGNGGAGGGALKNDDIDSGLRVPGGDEGLEFGCFVERAGVAGNAQGLCAGQHLIEFGESGFGEGQGGFEGFREGRFLAADEEQAAGAGLFAADGDGFEDDLRPFEGQAADLDDADGRQGKMLFGEDFADQSGNAAHVSGTGDEGADFDDCGTGIGFQKGFEALSDLLREKPFSGEGSYVKNEIARFGGDGLRGFFGEFEDLGNVLLFGGSVFKQRGAQEKYEEQCPTHRFMVRDSSNSDGLGR